MNATAAATAANLSDLAQRIVEEGAIGMVEAGALYGKHQSTAVRHALRGVRLTDGTLIKLEVIRTGQSLRTSRPVVFRFLAALTADLGNIDSPKCPTATDDSTARELDAAGL